MMKRLVLFSGLPVTALNSPKFYLDETDAARIREKLKKWLRPFDAAQHTFHCCHNSWRDGKPVDAWHRASHRIEDCFMQPHTVVSAVGHPGTAARMSVDLGVDVACQRIEVSDIRYPDICIIAVPRNKPRPQTPGEVTEIEAPDLRYWILYPASTHLERYIGRPRSSQE